MPPTPAPEFVIPANCPLCETGEGIVRQWKFSDVTVEVQPCDDCRAVAGVTVVTLTMSWAVRAVRPDVALRHHDGLVVFV